MGINKELLFLFDVCFKETEKLSKRHFRIGPTPISCTYYGDFDISFFTYAISHLEEKNADTNALNIIIIDVKSTQKPIPKSLWQWPTINPYNGEMLGMPEGYYGNCNTITQTLILIDFTRYRMLFWAKDVASFPEYERSFPLRQVLFFWHKKTNFVLVHGGAVGFKSGGVLLAGLGGSGKSTSTMACLNSALKYAGDDFVLANTEQPFIHSLYNVAKLEASNFHRFPNLEPHIYNKHEMPKEKGQLFLNQFMPEKVINGFPLKAILLPKFTGNVKTKTRKASAIDAMLALAPSSTLLLRTSTEQVKLIAKLVRSVPAFWLETGTDLSDIPLQIEKILKEEYTL